MPPLDNPQHEKFARLVASGNAYRAAYVKAGFKAPRDDNSNAAHLAARKDVAARIFELKQHQAERIGVTVDSLVKEYDQMIALAKKVKHPAAGVGAITAKATLLGFNMKPEQEGGTLRKPMREPTEVKEMSIDEWTEKFAPPSLKDAKPGGTA